jgi:hypothetical protein
MSNLFAYSRYRTKDMASSESFPPISVIMNTRGFQLKHRSLSKLGRAGSAAHLVILRNNNKQMGRNDENILKGTKVGCLKIPSGSFGGVSPYMYVVSHVVTTET